MQKMFNIHKNINIKNFMLLVWLWNFLATGIEITLQLLLLNRFLHFADHKKFSTT